MGTIIKEMKKNYFVSMIVTIALGVILVARPDLMGKLLCTILGVAIIIMGVIQLVVYLRGEKMGIVSKFSLVMSVILILLGIWVIFSHEAVLSLIPIVVGILLVMHGIMDFQYTWDIKNTGAKRWWLALLAAALTIVAGLLLIFHAYLAFKDITRLIGFFLLYDGLSDLVLIVTALIQQKQSDKRVREFKG